VYLASTINLPDFRRHPSGTASEVSERRAHRRLDNAAGRQAELQAPTEGFQTAFAVAVGIGALGVLLALVVLRPQLPIGGEALQADAAPLEKSWR
jgi:hypothetical protein